MPDDITSLTQRHTKNVPMTKAVRRGFSAVLAFMEEDLSTALDDPKGPFLRRLKGGDRADAIRAIKFLRQRREDLRSAAKKEAAPDAAQ